MGLFLGVACGLYAGLVIARPYLSLLSADLHLFGLCAAGFGLLTALAAPLAFPGVRARVRRVVVARPRVVGLGGNMTALPSLGDVAQWGLFVLPFLVLIGFAIRPALQTVRGQTDPAVIRYVAGLQRLEHLPVDGRRQYYESSLNWVLWYLGIPSVLLAAAGAALLGRRLVRGALAWRESLIAARLWALPYLIIGWSVVTVLWDPAVLPDQPQASHRLVPVVLPGLILLALWVSSRLKARAASLGASGVTSVVVGLCCVLAMAIPPFVTSMNPGLAGRPSVGRYSSGLSKFVSRVRFNGVGASPTYGGSLAAVSRLCSAIGTDASVIFVDTTTTNMLSQVVRGECGQPAASVAGAPAVTLEEVVTSIERSGAGRCCWGCRGAGWPCSARCRQWCCRSGHRATPRFSPDRQPGHGRSSTRCGCHRRSGPRARPEPACRGAGLRSAVCGLRVCVLVMCPVSREASSFTSRRPDGCPVCSEM